MTNSGKLTDHPRPRASAGRRLHSSQCALPEGVIVDVESRRAEGSRLTPLDAVRPVGQRPPGSAQGGSLALWGELVA
jgi:hypothetical protein